MEDNNKACVCSVVGVRLVAEHAKEASGRYVQVCFQVCECEG